MNDMRFHEDELVAILLAAQRDRPEDDSAGAFTTEELTNLTGIGRYSIIRRLRLLMGKGMIESVRKSYVRIDGVHSSLAAYRLIRRGGDDEQCGQDSDKEGVPGDGDEFLGGDGDAVADRG